VHCHFEKYDKDLRPGTYMNAQIEINNQNVATLPVDAIVSKGGKEYVFLQDSKQNFVLTPVELGARENGYMEIKNAQQLTGKNIVIKGSYALLMEMTKETEEE